MKSKKQGSDPLKEAKVEKPGTFWQLCAGVIAHPWKTAQSLVVYKPGYRVVTLILTSSLLVALSLKVQASIQEMVSGPGGFILGTILVTAIAGGAIALWNYLIYWFGRVLGGRGDVKEVFTALVWASIPGLAGLFFGFLLDLSDWPRYLADLAIGSNGHYYGNRYFYYEHLGMWFAYLIRLVDLVGWWNLILSIIFLSVAHRISVARSIGVHFLVLMVLMIVVVVPFMILGGMTLLAHLTNHGM